MKTLIALIACLALAFAAAADTHKATWLVKVPHTAEECLAALDAHREHDQKLLSKFDWGCMDGDHTGYLKTDADSAEAAIEKLPLSERKNAKATKVVKFTPEQIRSFHKK